MGTSAPVVSWRVSRTPSVGSPPTSRARLSWPAPVVRAYQSTSSPRWTRPVTVVAGASGVAASGVSLGSPASAGGTSDGGCVHSYGPHVPPWPHSPTIDRYASDMGASMARRTAGTSQPASPRMGSLVNRTKRTQVGTSNANGRTLPSSARASLQVPSSSHGPSGLWVLTSTRTRRSRSWGFEPAGSTHSSLVSRAARSSWKPMTQAGAVPRGANTSWAEVSASSIRWASSRWKNMGSARTT